MSWHIWIIASAILFILEIVVPGFLLACFGIGCLGAGIFSFLGFGIEIQLIAFSVISLIVFFGIRPSIVKYFYKSSEQLKTNVDALIGKTGIVIQKIDPQNHKGRVKVGGEDWRGETLDESIIDVGEKIEVLSVESSKLIVKKV